VSDPVYLALDEWGGTANGWPAMALPAVAVQVHHSVTNEDVGVNPTADAIADFLELDGIGLSRGHGGISYSYAIHPNGTIGEGQGTRRGAHTAGNGCGGSPWGWNPCSFGVVFVGNFDPATGGDEPTPAAIRSFRWLIWRLKADGLLVADAFIRGHRDAPGNPTGCPGDNLEAALPQLGEPWAPPPAAPLPKEGPDMEMIVECTADQTGQHPDEVGRFWYFPPLCAPPEWIEPEWKARYAAAGIPADGKADYVTLAGMRDRRAQFRAAFVDELAAR